jgi:hypothetical protein
MISGRNPAFRQARGLNGDIHRAYGNHAGARLPLEVPAEAGTYHFTMQSIAMRSALNRQPSVRMVRFLRLIQPRSQLPAQQKKAARYIGPPFTVCAGTQGLEEQLQCELEVAVLCGRKLCAVVVTHASRCRDVAPVRMKIRIRVHEIKIGVVEHIERLAS